MIDLQEIANKHFQSPLKNIQVLQGGDINDVYRLHTESRTFVIKVNNANLYPQMFECEAEGLNLLQKTETFRIPEIIALGTSGDQNYLILEHINSSRKCPSFWEDFGQSLANLHRKNSDFFGLEHDNYIGSLTQQNSQMKSWPAFYITQRLMPLIEPAVEKKLLDSKTLNDFKNLFVRLQDILPEEAPSLIHGDLWSGNFLTDEKGLPVLIDPAVCFASREMDLAMSRLFGGFPQKFYDAYFEAYPVEIGLEDRIQIYQLYYLMVHLNLFGISYLSSIKRILQRF